MHKTTGISAEYVRFINRAAIVISIHRVQALPNGVHSVKKIGGLEHTGGLIKSVAVSQISGGRIWQQTKEKSGFVLG